MPFLGVGVLEMLEASVILLGPRLPRAGSLLRVLICGDVEKSIRSLSIICTSRGGCPGTTRQKRASPSPAPLCHARQELGARGLLTRKTRSSYQLNNDRLYRSVSLRETKFVTVCVSSQGRHSEYVSWAA